MRRSAAPSLQSTAKRLKFISPQIDYGFDLEENDLFSSFENKCGMTFVKESQVEKNVLPNSSQSTEEILQWISAAEHQNPTADDGQLSIGGLTVESKLAESSSSPGCSHHYSVLYCKRTAKKHKIWEGDGTLIVTNRSALLKDSEGKIIDRGSGYKLKETESIEDGSIFYVGGKECEIQHLISSEEVQNVAPKTSSMRPQQISKSHETGLFMPSSHSKIPKMQNSKLSNLHSKSQVLPSPSPEKDDSNSACNTDDILKLISEAEAKADREATMDISSSDGTAIGDGSKNSVPSPKTVARATEEFQSDQTNCNLDQENNVRHYSVFWCKRSSKKHKTWGGEGTLIITDRKAILKDTNGKELDRGIGYKLKEVQSLEDGSKFYVGSKECEIQCLLSAGIGKESDAANTEQMYDRKLSEPYTVKKSSASRNFKPVLKTEKIDDDPYEALVFPRPSEEHQMMYNKSGLPITDVKVDRFLVKELRSHQKEGIVFLYKCILGLQHDLGHGAILADEMGLGKTLQCIALIWTLYKQGPYGGKPILRNVIIITPSSLVANWKKEFSKWLGDYRLPVFHVEKKHTVKDFLRSPQPVLILSYEMLLRSATTLSSVPFDLVVCDEGHRIKNLNIKISTVINCLETSRRILLTGTPIQNDLAEFFSIVDFVNPGALGSIQSFRRSYEKPILQSRDQLCTAEEKEMGDLRSDELNQISSLFMLRRTQEVINQYLPSKTESVVFCRPTEFQSSIYKNLLNTGPIWRFLNSSTHASLQLVYISFLRKLCNHPSLLYHSENSDGDCDVLDCVAFPKNYKPCPKDSGKLKVLENMLASFFTFTNKEKIVIVSGFTQTLNIIECMCKGKGYQLLRLDGSTATSSRQDLVDVFNRSYTKYNIFLLSSKAGGVGFNLIGASRIVLYDIDWNPANDLQAMARIWRDGQKHSVYIYRLLTTGTIEEKIYQRQLSKQHLSGSVLNPSSKEKLNFSQEELRDLFTFHEDTDCLTHDIMGCPCLSSDEVKDDSINNGKIEIPDPCMKELIHWKHLQGPSSTTVDTMLKNCGSDISFMFVNRVNFPSECTSV